MVRPKKEPEIIRNRLISIRVTEQEYSYLSSMAEKAGLRFSEYCRNMLMEGRVIHRFEIVADMNAVKAVARKLSGIGNNLNQIAAFFNSGGIQSRAMLENINHAISCIFEMREQVAEMAGKNYGNLKAHRK